MSVQWNTLSRLGVQLQQWLRQFFIGENIVVLQLYLSSMLGVIGRMMYDTYVQGQSMTVSGSRIVVSIIIVTAVFSPIYLRVKKSVFRLPSLMRCFAGFQLGFVADSIVDTLLVQPLQLPVG